MSCLPSRVLALSLSCLAWSACAADADEAGESEGNGDAPSLAVDPELVFHPKQPMVVDVLVTLDRSGTVTLTHASDPGVLASTLSVEDDGKRHHLRVRGLAPASEHDVTLTLAASDDPDASVESPLRFTTQAQLPGFRPSFEVELGDANGSETGLDPSYRLFDYANTPLWDPAGIFVIDTAGVTRWYYEGGLPELLAHTAIWAGLSLLDDGSLLSVRDGAITIVDELGEQPLRIAAADYDLAPFHHEVIMLANGNILTLGNSFRDVDLSPLNIGVGVTHVAGDLLVEFDVTGDIVWMWDAFDHLDPLRIRSVVGDGLEYVNPETGEPGFDWTHGNGMVERDGVILLSMRHQDWLVAIDHAADAPTGEVLWRLGIEGDFELLDGTWFRHQHSPQWQSDGTLLLYDNALDFTAEPGTTRSRAVTYALDFDALTATQVWDSATGTPYLSPVAGDADVTPNGNVLILDSTLQPNPAEFDIGHNYSRIVEVGESGDASPIWSLTTKTGSFVYRATTIPTLPGAIL